MCKFVTFFINFCRIVHFLERGYHRKIKKIKSDKALVIFLNLVWYNVHDTYSLSFFTREKVLENRAADKKKASETALLKHSNKIVDIPLEGFTSHECDLFWALCYFAQGKGEEDVEISLDEYRVLLGLERRGDRKLISQMQVTSQKFSNLSFTEETEKEWSLIVPFYGFRINKSKKTFTVQVHKDFVKALNNLDGSPGHLYSITDVRAMCEAKSVFTKHALKWIFFFRDTGYWEVSLEDLRKQLDVPKGYRLGNIKQRVIEPIKNDCEELGIFERFEIKEIKNEEQSGKGRKKITGYKFYFKFRDDYFTTGPFFNKDYISCPKCGKPLYKMNRKNGSGSFYGHYGGHKAGASCSYTINEKDIHVVPTSAVTVVEDDAEPVVNVSKGELERYYEFIRSEEQKALRERKDRARREDPVLWDLYEDCQAKISDLVNSMTSFKLSEESREDEGVKEALSKARESLYAALNERGLGSDYFELHYRCPECKDYGTRPDGLFCSCRKERAKEAVEWLAK